MSASFVESRGHGLAAAGHPSVAEAAVEVMRAGGNAFDAVAAAGFAAAVAEPALTSLGGGGFLLARPAEGPARLFDFFADTPGRALPAGDLAPHFLPVTVRFPGFDQVFNAGLGSAAVPGNLKGYLHVHEQLGQIPLREVLAPAIEFAREGVPLDYHQAYFLGLLEPIMLLTPRSRALYAPAGRALREGEHLGNPQLASFLDELPNGAARDFYEGDLARRVARDMRAGQGLLTAEDLGAYRVIEREPLSARYRGFELLTNPPPSFGGTLLALALELLEARLRDAPSPESAAYGLALLDVMQQVEGRRDAHLGEMRRFSRGTTHVSVCDGAGNAASMTTSNGEGSGYVVPDTGVMLNNMLGEDDLHPDGFHASPAGERVASMMSPSILLGRDGIRMILGSGGSKRIRTALLQAVSLSVDFDWPVHEVVAHPRIHWDGDVLQAEPGLAPELLSAIRARASVNEWSCLDVYFGGVNAVEPDNGGAGDPRRGGAARSV